MNNNNFSLLYIDWISVILYSALVILGLASIYSSSFSSAGSLSVKQLIFIILTIPIIFTILYTDGKFYEKYASIIYVVSLISLLGLFVFGKELNGQRCWYSFGSLTLQPSEFAKVATALAIAKYLSISRVNLKNFRHQFEVLIILFLPILLILPQPDPGSALIFSVFFLVLHLEGLPSAYLLIISIAVILFVSALVIEPIYIIILIGLILIFINFKTKINITNILISVAVWIITSSYVWFIKYAFDNILKQHHRDRFNILLGKTIDMKGTGYNTNQAKIAIGSGGFSGKGFLEGTQTKGGFVPEQHTDYIFSTVGEEGGFLGVLLVIGLFTALLLRLIFLIERQKTKFSKAYGYAVVSILFFHFFINIAMVTGLFPTIGVPLPFFSYGGSSLWSFTILLFIFIKLDADRLTVRI